MQTENEADVACPLEGVHEVDLRRPRDAEHVFHAFGLEDLHQGSLCGGAPHVRPPEGGPGIQVRRFSDDLAWFGDLDARHGPALGGASMGGSVRVGPMARGLGRERVVGGGPVDGLLLQQLTGQGLERDAVLPQHRLGTLQLLGHQPAHLGVDDFLGLRAQLAVVLHHAAQVLQLLAGVAHRAQLLAHAELGDHAPDQLGRLLDVVAGAGADGAEHGQLRRPAAQHHGDAVVQLVLGEDVAVLGGHLQGVAERSAGPGDDADLGHRVGVGEESGHQRVAGFVDRPPSCRSRSFITRVFFSSPAMTRSMAASKSLMVTDGGVAPRGEQGRLVHGVGQVGAAEARA